MNYQRVPLWRLHLQWKHIKGYWSVVQIVYEGTPVAQGEYQEMVDLLEHIRAGSKDRDVGVDTVPVDLDFQPPPMVKKLKA